MKKAFDFSYKAKSKTEVDIHIFGIIGVNELYWGDGTNNKAYAIVSLIKRLDKQYDRINVHINSPGGNVWDGLAIYNALKAAKAEIHTYNAGFVGSMASIIMLAGTTHFPKTSVYHLHSALKETYGNIQAHRDAIKALEAHEDALQAAIVSRTGMSIEDIQAKWFDGKDHYMSGESAHELGFVDVLEDLEADPPTDKATMENMKYKDVMAFYHPDQEHKPNKGFKGLIKSVLNINSNNNEKSQKMDNPIKFKAKLTILLAIFGLQEFVLNANNKIEMSIDQAHALNDELQSKDNEINNLKAEKAEFENTMKAKNDKIAELQAIVDQIPGGPPANPKGGDNITGGDDDPVEDLDDDTSKKLREYNKTSGISLV